MDLLEIVIKSLIYVNIIILLVIIVYSFLSALGACFTKKSEVENNNKNKDENGCIVDSLQQKGQEI